MKTHELKKIIEDNGLRTEKLEQTEFYRVLTKDSLCVCSFHNDLHDIKIHNSCSKVIAQAILDYVYTPLLEREEEKKYRLKSPLTNSLNKTLYISKFDLGNYLSAEKIDEFTQNEINAMPFDINFFIKEEVK